MGKIRVKAFGDEEQEQKQKDEEKKRKQAKKTAKAPGMKGGERVVAVGPSEEELAALEVKAQESVEEPKSEVKHKKEREQKAFHSQKYQTLSDQFDRTKTYSIKEALELLEKLQRKSFDETVELHLNTVSTGVSGQITLPHGTGKTTRVAIADDKLIADVERGVINFDVLVAEPAMMAKLAKVAKILGPKGLMPNPKNGTITPKPEEVAKKYSGGQINFKTETKAPIIHLTVGKMSFGPEKLTENIEALIAAIKKVNIVNATLKSTMSPGLKISI
ncbi:MAG: 50S ribosomal protein L1 [Candidatus Levyibacteriota bacterium]